MKEFKEQFWEWYDNLSPEAKKSYMYAHADIAEDFFREFFYNKQ